MSVSRRIVAFASIMLALMVVGTGCSTSVHTTGRPITDQKVSKIVKGTTTLEDVITIFGKPTEQSEMGSNVLYTYRYAQTKGKTMFMPYVTSGDSTEQADELTITFDKTTATVKAFSLQRGIAE